MIRTGEDTGIRSAMARRHINGERFRDVTTHPSFKPVVDIRARIYDMAHDPRTRDVMTYEGTASDRRSGSSSPTRPKDWRTSARRSTPSCGTWAASPPGSAMRRLERCVRCGTARISLTRSSAFCREHPKAQYPTAPSSSTLSMYPPIPIRKATARSGRRSGFKHAVMS